MPVSPALDDASRHPARIAMPSAGMPFAALVAIATLVAGGCSRPQPSEEYAEASRLFSAALAEHGDDAYDDPRAAEALELTKLVPSNSLDSEAASFLAGRIREGMKAAQERREYLEEMRDAAQADAEELEDFDGEGEDDDDFFGEFAFGEDEEDAPPPVAGLLRPGSPASDFTRRYAGCYQVGKPFVETGGTREGLSYSLADTDDCREKHPEMQGMLVYISGDRVFNIGPASAAKTLDLVKDGDGFKPAPPAAPVAEPEPEEEVTEIVLERD